MAKSDEELKELGFNTDDIQMQRRFERELVKLKDNLKIEFAKKKPDFVKVITMEESIKDYEFVMEYRGVDPRKIPVPVLSEMLQASMDDDASSKKYRERICNPATAIRAKCVECMGGSIGEIKACQDTNCPLWPFRMGTNPLFNKKLPPVEDITLEDDDEVVIEEETVNEDADTEI